MISPHTMQMLIASVEALRAELGEDDADCTLRTDMLAGSTDLDVILSRLTRAALRARADASGANAAMEEACRHYERRIAIAEASERTAKAMIRMALEAAGLARFAIPEGKISIIAGRPSVVIEDADQLPQGYYKSVRKPETAAIKTALLDGATIPGASLSYGNPSVRIA